MEIMHWKDRGILVEKKIFEKKSVGNAGYKKHDI